MNQFFAGRGDHGHRDDVTTSAEAIEQAYRRGAQQAAHVVAGMPAAEHAAYLKRLSRWRFELPLGEEPALPGSIAYAPAMAGSATEADVAGWELCRRISARLQTYQRDERTDAGRAVNITVADAICIVREEVFR